MPNAPCTPYKPKGFVFPCYFGVAADHARATVALIGDSHAEHWRAAIEVVAQSKRWRGISLTRSGCPLNTAGREAANADRTTTTAAAGRARSGSFLAEHEEVHTVFVAARASADFARDPAEGARRALRALPKNIRRVYVLRATPETFGPENGCVSRRLRAKQTIGTSCALPRAPSSSPTRRPGPRAAASGSSTSRSTCATRPSAHRSSAACSYARTAHTSRAPSRRRSARSCCARSADRRVPAAAAREAPALPPADAIVWIASH